MKHPNGRGVVSIRGVTKSRRVLLNTSLDIALTALVMAARQFIVAEIDYAAAVETGRGNGRIAHARDYRDKAERVLTDAIAAFADAVIAEASKA